MEKVIAKVDSTFLGIEDHGLFIAMLTVTYGGGEFQGIGTHALDSYDAEKKKRIGTAYGADYIKRILQVCGVDQWEKLKGRTIYVLKEDGTTGLGWGGDKVLGIASLPTEGYYEFIFEDLRKEFFDE